MHDREIKNKICEIVSCNLAENYQDDMDVLKNIVDEVSDEALSISNRQTIIGLESEIAKCVRAEYLQRGAEGLKSLSEGGRSSSFEDNIEKMRNNIVKNGKRVIF